MEPIRDLTTASREELVALILALQEQVAQLTAQVEDLLAKRGGGPPAPPSWVKPNRPQRPEPKLERKPREHGFSRRRAVPTETHVHLVKACPDCGCRLLGGWVKARRQVLDVPVAPVRVIEHVLYARVCPQCGRRCVPTLDLGAEVVGQHRVSLRTVSLVATLRTVGRLPIRTIQWILETFHGLRLSTGELVELLHTVAERGQTTLDALQAQIRGSPVVHGDETGWREDGQHGWVWTFSTPTVRCFLYRPSRSGQIVTEVLGEAFDGVLVSDCYGGYNRHAGRHQRCWVHLLRDIHALSEAHPDDAALQTWADAVYALYERAKTTAERTDLNDPAREAAQHAFEAHLAALGEPFLADASAPQRVLCERIERYLPEWFVFVADPRVPSENNAAERSLRPLVVARKISGGTRSPKGSTTTMALASLFGTWLVQGRNPFAACCDLLSSP